MDEPLNILIAEDSDAEVELVRFVLKRHKISGVHFVRDGAEALDFLFCKGSYTTRNPNQLPKVVILDINMPKIGGLTVLERIRSDERTQNLPVIIMTNSNDWTDVEEARRCKANNYVQKPMDFREFVTLFGALLTQWL